MGGGTLDQRYSFADRFGINTSPYPVPYSTPAIGRLNDCRDPTQRGRNSLSASNLSSRNDLLTVSVVESESILRCVSGGRG